MTEDNPVWSGTATELVEQLGVDLKPNALTLKLNLTAGRLLNDYGIVYETTRTHNGRNVTLKRKRDDRDDVLHTAPTIKKIVTTVTVVTENFFCPARFSASRKRKSRAKRGSAEGVNAPLPLGERLYL